MYSDEGNSTTPTEPEKRGAVDANTLASSEELESAEDFFVSVLPETFPQAVSVEEEIPADGDVFYLVPSGSAAMMSALEQARGFLLSPENEREPPGSTRQQQNPRSARK